MRHKFSLLWSWLVMLATNWLPDMPATMRLRGRLLALCMKSCGRDFQVASGARIKGLTHLSVGHHVYFANGVLILAGQEVVIGDEVMLGPFVVIADGNHTADGQSCRFGQRQNAPIRINTGAWLGAHCTVVAGASIGCGTIVGANSVVKDELPARVLAAGLPARVVKELGN